MNRTYMPMIDNGLFIVEYYLDVPYRDIAVSDLYDNLDTFAEKISELLETKEFFRKIAYSTHMNSSFTQTSKNKSKYSIIKEQFDNILDNVGQDKNCIYCGEKRVNLDFAIDRKFMYGLISQTFFNSSNNLQTIDMCPICAFLSMLSILNTQKIGMPTLYISDSDDFMRSYTESMQKLIGEASKIEEKIDISGNLKYDKLLEISIDTLDIKDIGYITQFCFMNAGQIVSESERTYTRKEIKLLSRLKEKQLLDEFMNLGFHRRLNNNLQIEDVFAASKELIKELEGYNLYNLNEKEKDIVDYVTKTLLKIESSDKLLKEIKLCNNKMKFNSLILQYSEKETLVRDVKDYDMLTGYNWKKYRDYINMNILIQQEEAM